MISKSAAVQETRRNVDRQRRRGYGSKLIEAIESCFPNRRYELFTSTRSSDNIRLYQKLGYTIFDSKTVNDELKFVYMEKRGV